MSSKPSHERRVICLDGLRGLMTVTVVISHYFGEVPHGVSGLMFGWIAVDMFFVLSGYLIGKLILEKGDNDNFFAVFYARRVCRTLPIYFVCVAIVGTLAYLIAAPWVDSEGGAFPLWSYFTFTQNIWMLVRNGIGLHWLAPSWTLSIEEQFYLIVPLLFFVVPRRRLHYVLAAIAIGAVISRWTTLSILGPSHQIAASVLLPNRADVLVAGLLAAIAYKTEGLPWDKLMLPLRAAPIAALVIVGALYWTDQHGLTDEIALVFGPLLTSAGCAAFLLALVRGAPEVERFKGAFLGFFNTTSYAVYLVHLPVLGLMHGLILGSKPDVATPAQLAVTVAALPVTVAVAWVLTTLVERPLTEYGRSFAWSGRSRRPQAIAPVPIAAATKPHPREAGAR